MRSVHCLFASLVLTASGTLAQAQVPRSQQDFVALYLQEKEREFQASERAIQARNLGAHSTAIYNLLREKRPFARNEVIGRDSAEKERVREALTRTVAHFLTGIGLTPDAINRLQRAGLDPLQAGANLIGSTPRLEDALTVSPIVVVAEVTANNPVGTNLVDRQLAFAPRRSLKGALQQPLTVHLQSPAPPSNAEPGSQYLLFLSAELGPFQRAAGRQDEGPLAWVTLPWEVRGGSYLPVSPGQDPAPRTAAEVEAFIGRYPSIFSAQ